ncbi:MAG: IclR family transcriptional regulator [Planctomycetaceae bacterium]|nr:IclR family transcriptional regulator [Planctomycetaceae bacterium]
MVATSLDKAFHLIEALAVTNREVTLTSLVSALGYHKSTVHRLLQDLVELGYVCRVDKGKYQITGKLRRLALGKIDDVLLESASPYLRALHKQTGETINLGVLRGVNIRYLQVIESKHPLRRMVEVNSKDPFYSTALGRAITSRLSEEAWDALMAQTELVARTPQTIIDLQELRKIHNQAQQDGYATEKDQNDIGITCVGAPILEGDEIIAAISISAPTARVGGDSQKTLIDAVLQAAKQISDQLSS